MQEEKIIFLQHSFRLIDVLGALGIPQKFKKEFPTEDDTQQARDIAEKLREERGGEAVIRKQIALLEQMTSGAKFEYVLSSALDKDRFLIDKGIIGESNRLPCENITSKALTEAHLQWEQKAKNKILNKVLTRSQRSIFMELKQLQRNIQPRNNEFFQAVIFWETLHNWAQANKENLELSQSDVVIITRVAVPQPVAREEPVMA